MKKLRLSKLREKAFKYLSLYKRQLGMDGNGYNRCITCGKSYHWKLLHGGHFVHGHSKPTYLLEMNVHAQCFVCNHYLSGHLLVYNDFMIDKYGKDKVDELRSYAYKVVKFDRSYYEAIIQKYKEANSEDISGK